MKNDDRFWIALKVANFLLVIDGQKLLMTTKEKHELEIVLDHYQKLDPKRQYVTKNFGVKVLRRNRDGKVLDWKEIEGYSIWEIMF